MAPPSRLRRLLGGLSGRVIALSIIFVMIAQIAIYLPAIATFRRDWIARRLSSAYIAALVLQGTPTPMVPRALKQELLASVGAKLIVITIHGMHRILAVSDMPPRIDESYDIRSAGLLTDIPAALRALLAPAGRMLNVTGPAPMGGRSIEIVIDETTLRAALRTFSLRLLEESLVISAIVASLAAIATGLAVLRPVRRLTRNLMEFGADPENPARIIVPTKATHEIAAAERALKAMQDMLAQELRAKKNLAALGLAVAKINHDLRNMLSSAQLLTDRLADLPDPQTRLLAPRLVATLDRAIRFCQATLAFGKAGDEAPQRRKIDLHALVDDVFATLPVDPKAFPETCPLRLVNKIQKSQMISADPGQLQRVLGNLCKNAGEALASMVHDGSPVREATIIISARRHDKATVIDVVDNGPGLSAAAAARLFAPFGGSGRAGSTGLGLAIASDLVRGHGGSLTLVAADKGAQPPGATFRILLPDPPGVNKDQA
ncbi:MAG: HAMP domain-containing histidine kinase [Hyphomicrobiales bacterium]|nr:HAMP domain-containing histidine kinase [Hyphomicrobiales bacterium]